MDHIKKIPFALSATKIMEKVSSGNFRECIKECNDNFRKYPEAHVLLKLLGFCHSQIDLNKKAIKYYINYLRKVPSDMECTFNLATVYIKEKKYALALELFRKLQMNDKNYPNLYKNIGYIYDVQGKLEKARTAYDIAHTKNVNDSEIPINVLNMYLREREYEKGLQYANAMVGAVNNLDSNCEFLTLYASALHTFGAINDTCSIYEKILGIETENVNARESLHHLFVQNVYTKHMFQDGTHRSNFSTILNAIHTFICNGYAYRTKIQSELDSIVDVDDSNQKDFIVAYKLFISKLLEHFSPPIDLDYDSEVVHFGESHCLSFAHEQITFDQGIYKIVPSIVFGAKAFHLANDRANPFKTILGTKVKSLQKGRKLIFSFGEIDCRLDEGFLKQKYKDESDMVKNISKIVDNYVSFLYDLVKDDQHEVMLTNVPAPVVLKDRSMKLQKKRAMIIALFNDKLKEKARSVRFKVIDVHSITSDHLGYSNGKFHIDSIHLKPEAIHAATII